MSENTKDSLAEANAPMPLTETDVRRIVREELGRSRVQDVRLGPGVEREKQMLAAQKRFTDELIAAVNTAKKSASAVTLTDGSPVTPDHREIDPRTGQQKGYVILSAEERAKGFVRPVRRSYQHVGEPPRLESDKSAGVRQGGCGAVTTMALSLAETYARDPSFYSGTFCATCRKHFPLDQFVWDGTQEQVGS